MENMILSSQEGILKKKWMGNLSAHTQANCQISLTDDGYRIYRPANQNNSSNGGTNNMWGGFVLNFPTPPFIKTHTYIIAFNIKGQTSNAPSDVGWNNNVGWNGGGLTPSPSNVVIGNIGANWQSNEWTPVYYKWTINDDVYKTCTSSYSSFVEGNIYPSYKGFKYGFGYTNTGTLGTDLYINNIRMYDITNLSNSLITEQGIILPSEIIEINRQKTTLQSSQDIICYNFYEY